MIDITKYVCGFVFFFAINNFYLLLHYIQYKLKKTNFNKKYSIFKNYYNQPRPKIIRTYLQTPCIMNVPTASFHLTR